MAAAGLTVPVNQGAPTTGEPFPGTDPRCSPTPARPWRKRSSASAARRAARSRALPEPYTQPCSQILATDVIYAPVWTHGVTTPQADANIDYLLRHQRDGRLQPGHSEHAADDHRQLHSLERAMPDHHPLREPGFESRRSSTFRICGRPRADPWSTPSPLRPAPSATTRSTRRIRFKCPPVSST